MVTITQRYSYLQNKKRSRCTIRKKGKKENEYLKRRNERRNSFPDNGLIAKFIFRVIVDQRGEIVIRFRVRVMQKWELPLRSHDQLKVRKTSCSKSGCGSSCCTGSSSNSSSTNSTNSTSSIVVVKVEVVVEVEVVVVVRM